MIITHDGKSKKMNPLIEKLFENACQIEKMDSEQLEELYNKFNTH